MVTTHKHRVTERKTYGYCGYSVRPDSPNPVAHGGVTHHDRCKCGATRKINSTGAGREERGRWAKPTA